MPLTIPRRANPEIVAAAYIRAMVAAYDTAVGAVLQGPDPETGRITWSTAGFIQVSGITGAIDPYVPVRHSVVSLDVWAAPPGQSKKPPWGLAFALAELVIASTFDTLTHDTHAVVTLPTGYPDARVTGFRALTDPARRPADPSDYARVGFDCELAWHGLGTSWTVTS